MLGEVEAAHHQPQSSQSGQTVSCQLLPDLSYHEPGHKVFSLVSPLPVFSSPSMHQPLPHIKLCLNEPQQTLSSWRLVYTSTEEKPIYCKEMTQIRGF